MPRYLLSIRLVSLFWNLKNHVCVTVPFFPSILVTTEAFSLACARAELKGWPSGSLSPIHPEAQLHVIFL